MHSSTFVFLTCCLHQLHKELRSVDQLSVWNDKWVIGQEILSYYNYKLVASDQISMHGGVLIGTITWLQQWIITLYQIIRLNHITENITLLHMWKWKSSKYTDTK